MALLVGMMLGLLFRSQPTPLSAGKGPSRARSVPEPSIAMQELRLPTPASLPAINDPPLRDLFRYVDSSSIPRTPTFGNPEAPFDNEPLIPPVPPQAPPLPLPFRLIGLVSAEGHKYAVVVDDERELHIAEQGCSLALRYLLQRVGHDSIEVGRLEEPGLCRRLELDH